MTTTLLAQPTGINCPHQDRSETAADCPWAAFGRRLIKEANHGQAIAPLFTRLTPEITQQLRADAKQTKLKNLWSLALNQTPSSATIVDPRILEMLAGFLLVPVDQLENKHALHAGLLQTYGYLFSLTKTPKGFRRAPWVSGTLETGFGLPKGIFGPLPPTGTLLRNVTYFLGRFALADSDQALVILQQLEVPTALRDFAYNQVKQQRLEERVHIPQVTGREIQLRTDLVSFQRPNDEAAYLAVYSIFDPGEGIPRLVSGLPVSQKTAARLLAEETSGEQIVIGSRFEAYIEGLTGARVPLSGSRRLISVH